MEPQELISFQWSRESDPDGSKFRGLLQAQFAWEMARARRELFLYVVVIVSALGWLIEVWPHAADSLRRLAVLGWPLAAFGLVATACSEWRWQRKRAAYLTELDARPSDGVR